MQDRKRHERMAEVERQILQTIKDAALGAQDGQDLAYRRHEWMFDYKLDLRCYMQVPKKDDSLMKQKMSYIIDMKRNALTVSDVHSDLSDQYEPLLNEEFFDHMNKFQRTTSVSSKHSLAS